jgi:murein DD-endopeptidase MepM/ murein hydrolase activator NlpD
LGIGSVGCAGDERPRGFYHEVRAGENLYRIGTRYGVDPKTLARANRIADVTNLQIGQRIWIPSRRGQATARGKPPAAATHRSANETRRTGDLAFEWPVHGGSLTSRFGKRRGRTHEGVDLAAQRGTVIHASESGKVIHSGWLGDYGKVVIVKHAGHYRTVYAHARKLHVRKGQLVERGQRIAEVGTSGNASGPHLHFEIRRRETPQDPMLYLP